jgi:hypothetical protein
MVKEYTQSNSILSLYRIVRMSKNNIYFIKIKN